MVINTVNDLSYGVIYGEDFDLRWKNHPYEFSSYYFTCEWCLLRVAYHDLKRGEAFRMSNFNHTLGQDMVICNDCVEDFWFGEYDAE